MIEPKDPKASSDSSNTLGQDVHDDSHNDDYSINVGRVSATAERVLGSQANARSWLHTPNIALGMREPISLLDTNAGTNQVLSVLSAIEFGGSV